MVVRVRLTAKERARLAERVRLSGDDLRRLPKKYTREQRFQLSVEYEDVTCDLAFKFCLLGATNEQLAKFLGVAVVTIELWCRNNEEFREAVRRGRYEADAQVVHGLYRRSKGYDIDNIILTEGENAQGAFYKETRSVIHIPPDPTAALKFLAVRQKELWAAADPDKNPANVTVRIVGGLPPSE